jgi:putative transposase
MMFKFNDKLSQRTRGTFFFTVVTYRRRKILMFPESRTFLRQAIRQTQEKYPFRKDVLVLLKEDDSTFGFQI